MNEIENLILVCRTCHKEIDTYTEEFPANRLIKAKSAHERRIDLATGMLDDRRTHILIYGANVGGHRLLPSATEARSALLRWRHPARDRAIRIGTVDGAYRDRDAEFWVTEKTKLEADFRERVAPAVARGDIAHLSVFALAPQPLLVRLGTLLTQLTDVMTYQMHREPRGWTWAESESSLAFRVLTPDSTDGAPALVIAVSAAISNERVHDAIGPAVAPWRVTIDRPRHDAVRSPADLSSFRAYALDALNRIADAHGSTTPVHVFMAAPNSIGVELGRVRLEKSASTWRLYDQPSTTAGFVHAFDINS